jgi:hypothetical protein
MCCIRRLPQYRQARALDAGGLALAARRLFFHERLCLLHALVELLRGRLDERLAPAKVPNHPAA